MEELLSNYLKTADEVFDNFWSNMVKNLDITRDVGLKAFLLVLIKSKCQYLQIFIKPPPSTEKNPLRNGGWYLRVIINKKFGFEDHVTNLCKKHQ